MGRNTALIFSAAIAGLLLGFGAVGMGLILGLIVAVVSLATRNA